MISCTVLKEWKKFRDQVAGKKVGFVPTMGFLHRGHLSLIAAAKADCDLVVVSVFVNPKQFSDQSDFDNYPRDNQRDMAILIEAGVDCCLMPTAEEVYPDGEVSLEMKMPDLTNCLCGVNRSGHFEGVMLVVAKLFNIVKPDRVYFGQKDFQQCLVIKKMISDLNFDLELVMMPIVREDNGLAMSSRNARLSEIGKKNAGGIKEILDAVGEMCEGGETSVENLESYMLSAFEKLGIEVEYAEVRRAKDLSVLKIIEGEIVVAVAVWVEGVRLIDNVIIKC